MYVLAAKLAVLAENGQSYKNVLYSQKNRKIVKSTYFLVCNAVKRKKVIDELLFKVGLWEDVKEQVWLARILMTELLWGKKRIPNDRPVFKLIAKHKSKFSQMLPTLNIETNLEGEIRIPRYIRINTDIFHKVSAVALLNEMNFNEVSCPDTYGAFLSSLKTLKTNEYMFDFHVPNLIIFNAKAKIDKLPQQSFIRQDKSSCLVSLLLAPLPGSTIMDMCAAPGYKTQHAASLISKMGTIYSIDINKQRYKTLESTCKDFQLEGCCHSLNMDTLKTTDSICPDVEYIIVDPPCSGTGIRNVLMRHTADDNRLKKLSNLQAMILKHALSNFPCARRIVYSTCSEEEQENEEVVSECMDTATQNGFSLVPLSAAFRGSFSMGRGSYTCSSSVLRTSAENDLTNGFFIALFERSVPPKLPKCGERSTLNTMVIEESEGKEEVPLLTSTNCDKKSNRGRDNIVTDVTRKGEVVINKKHQTELNNTASPEFRNNIINNGVRADTSANSKKKIKAKKAEIKKIGISKNTSFRKVNPLNILQMLGSHRNLKTNKSTKSKKVKRLKTQSANK